MRVWRIVRERWGTSAFDGQGAARTGNRWNPRGLRMVYASPSLALAALEVLVHADPGDLPGPFVAASAEVPEDIGARTLTPAQLPKNWRRYPAPMALQKLGEQWVREGSTAVLYVPSVVVPLERNVLLNPLHPEFGRVRVLPPVPFEFDPRLGTKS